MADEPKHDALSWIEYLPEVGDKVLRNVELVRTIPDDIRRLQAEIEQLRKHYRAEIERVENAVLNSGDWTRDEIREAQKRAHAALQATLKRCA